MAERDARGEKQDLTLLSNEFAWVLDETSGMIRTYSGPISSTVSQSETVVLFDELSKRFRSAATLGNVGAGKQLKIIAPEGWYAIIKNPSDKPPPDRDKASTPEQISIGSKRNYQGPFSFALWPGQMAKVIQGHHLRQDEYLVVRIYDEKAAADATGFLQLVKWFDEDGPLSVSTGALFIVEGTCTSFFIPPTGVEVLAGKSEVPGEPSQYVQKAVSLEALEYCLLLDQKGSKRYVQGPAVVFPEPTERFVVDGQARKFRAFELSPTQCVHVKVISAYSEPPEPEGAAPEERVAWDRTAKHYEVGDELVITGQEHPIYFPRVEHAFIQYGDRVVHSGVAIPKGEARYVLHRETGKIRIQAGPTVFLPDPRQEVFTKRLLSKEQCQLLFPNNAEALRANGIDPDTGDFDASVRATRFARNAEPMMTFNATMGSTRGVPAAMPGAIAELKEMAKLTSTRVSGDSINREGQYHAPRAIVLDTKFDGAVTVSLWEGYAMQLLAKGGGRRVLQGPQTVFLEYDEVAQVLELSTGKPKTTDKPYRTAYLRIANNYVTDVVAVETADFCKATLKVIYRLDFEGDPQKWFSVPNYVKFLCDHYRSLLRAKVKELPVMEFYAEASSIVQVVVFGDAEGERNVFAENGMVVHGIEVLEVNLDQKVKTLIEAQQFAKIVSELELEKSQRESNLKKGRATIQQQEEEQVSAATALIEGYARQHELAGYKHRLALMTAAQELEAGKRVEADRAIKARAEVATVERAIADLDQSLELVIAKRRQEMLVETRGHDAENTAKMIAAFSPQLIAALQGVADSGTIVKVAEAFSTQGLFKTLGGESLVDIVSKALAGTELAERLPGALGRNGITTQAIGAAE